jgi:hypothetical protein
MNIEVRLHIPRGDEYIDTAVGLLGESSSELLTTCADALDSVLSWLERNNTERFKALRSLFVGWRGAKQDSLAPTSEKDPENPENNVRVNGEDGAHQDEEARTPTKREWSVSEASNALKEVLENFKANDR